MTLESDQYKRKESSTWQLDCSLGNDSQSHTIISLKERQARRLSFSRFLPIHKVIPPTLRKKTMLTSKFEIGQVVEIKSRRERETVTIRCVKIYSDRILYESLDGSIWCETELSPVLEPVTKEIARGIAWNTWKNIKNKGGLRSMSITSITMSMGDAVYAAIKERGIA